MHYPKLVTCSLPHISQFVPITLFPLKLYQTCKSWPQTVVNMWLDTKGSVSPGWHFEITIIPFSDCFQQPLLALGRWIVRNNRKIAYGRLFSSSCGGLQQFSCNSWALPAQYCVFLAGEISYGKNFGQKKILAKKMLVEFFFWQLAGGSWQGAVGRWQLADGRWHVAQLLGAVKKAGIRCAYQLVVGGIFLT